MKPSNNEPPTNWPRPEEFPPGSLQSKAAARLLAGKRKASGFYIHIHNGCECEHCKRNEHGPNDIIISINNVSVLDEPGELMAPREKARPEAEVAPPIPQDEPILTVGAPHETELESNEKQSAERWAQFVGSRRRPLVRKPPYRRHRWPPSAYGL